MVIMVTKNIKVEFDAPPDGDAEDRYLNPDIHELRSYILAAKARVTPLKGGITIPRSIRSGALYKTDEQSCVIV